MTASSLRLARASELIEFLRGGRTSVRLVATNLVIYALLLAAVLAVTPSTEDLRARDEAAVRSIAEFAAQLTPGEVSAINMGDLRVAITAPGQGAVTELVPEGAERWVSTTITLADGRLLLAAKPAGADQPPLRERIVQLFVVAALISSGFSAAMVSAISRPISSLATVTQHALVTRNPLRLRIPSVRRDDEIGELFVALRHMVATFHERIDSNERFAADVAHEIKNPLASLRSAVSTLRIMKREEQRETLIRIIEHDVRRLDRLVSDISVASRLDAELESEEHEPFDVVAVLQALSVQLRPLAKQVGVRVVTDFPPGPLEFRGIADRLSQVVANLAGNALSLCVRGDAIRVWCRRKEQCIIIVVEDTGPGIPPDALERIFERFYSERPAEQFGEHSGLGLAISRQIVEAHGGVIWAENVVPGDYDSGAEPMGARFIVRLPTEELDPARVEVGKA